MGLKTVSGEVPVPFFNSQLMVQEHGEKDARAVLGACGGIWSRLQEQGPETPCRRLGVVSPD